MISSYNDEIMGRMHFADMLTPSIIVNHLSDGIFLVNCFLTLY